MQASYGSRFSADIVGAAQGIYGSDAKSVLDALAKPVQTYYVRCNTLRISPRELEQKLEDRGLKIERHHTIPEALAIRFEGPYDVPVTELKVVVDKHTAESTLQGANVYAPGILACGSMHIGDRVTIISKLGEVIGSGTALMSTNEVLTFRKGMAIRVDHRRFKGPQIRELPEFSEGLLYPQSLPAMVTSHVLDPQEGETVVDMNCAPGGKLSHLTQLMHNSGRIFGFDRNSEKIRRARQTVKSLGCKSAILSVHDSRYLHADFHDLKVDRVLIDPPCSALGLRPKIYDHTTHLHMQDLADYQKQFIKSASEIIRPGGAIVYSVCTFTIEECEQVVQFAEDNCGLHIVPQEPFLGSAGISSFGNSGVFCQRFHPHTDEIGYFIAKFER